MTIIEILVDIWMREEEQQGYYERFHNIFVWQLSRLEFEDNGKIYGSTLDDIAK